MIMTMNNIYICFYYRYFSNSESEPSESEAYSLIHRWA
jgi:hypothetical protein